MRGPPNPAVPRWDERLRDDAIIDESPLHDDAWIGASPALQSALHLIDRYAATSATVLVQGETGTGKELAARRIHLRSARGKDPFVAVNCGALPDALTESELFGHARGAFTDARDEREGVVAFAEGGTLFLDEVEALSQRAQIVLLRFLQDRTYRPLGGTREKRADVRIIAASNQSLGALARRGVFREDLVYRLAVMTVTLPPLRERGDDVVLLAEHFLRKLARDYATPDRRLAPDARDVLRRHSWPGNVRELENLVHRHFVLSDAPVVHLAIDGVEGGAAPPDPLELEPASGKPLDFRRAKDAAVSAFERRFLSDVLRECGGNVTRAAQRAGKERRAFGKLLKKHGIVRPMANPLGEEADPR